MSPCCSLRREPSWTRGCGYSLQCPSCRGLGDSCAGPAWRRWCVRCLADAGVRRVAGGTTDALPLFAQRVNDAGELRRVRVEHHEFYTEVLPPLCLKVCDSSIVPFSVEGAVEAMLGMAAKGRRS